MKAQIFLVKLHLQSKRSIVVIFVTSNMNLSVKEKQDLLRINNLKERALETLRYMNIELQKLELKMIFNLKSVLI
jgi:ATP-dependent Lon protease